MMSKSEGEQTDRLARGEAVPGGPGACAGCHHGKVHHNPRNRTRECERCDCKAYQPPAAKLMTLKEARAYQDDHGQAARDLCNTRRGELQAEWRDEMQRAGVLDPGKAPARKDELVDEILKRRFPFDKLNEATHVIYHAPGAPWDGCEHCQARPAAILINTSQLRPGDIVVLDGMRIRLEDVRQYVPVGQLQPAWTCPGTVLNAAEVIERGTPSRLLETYRYDDDLPGYVVDREDAWTVQGDQFKRWTVEVPRPGSTVDPAGIIADEHFGIQP